MAITNATILHRRGNINDLKLDKLLPGEYAVCDDGTIIVCYAPNKRTTLAREEEVDNKLDEKFDEIKKNLDKTLTKDGGYADAKVVGDTFKKIGDGSFFVSYSEETGELTIQSGSFLVDYSTETGNLTVQSTGLKAN